MAYISIEMVSGSLGKQVPLKVLMPQLPAGYPKCKCLYLLHGYSDDFSMWTRRTSIERFVSRYNIAVVMPDGGKSFYTNTAYGDNYYDYIAKELPDAIEAMFNVSSKPEDRFIGGISMGGYGALKAALREDGKYSAAISLSPVADIRTFARETYWVRWDAIFVSEKAVPDCDDIITLAENCKNRPRIYLAIGTEDFLYKNNIPVRRLFEKLGYDFHYEECPGDHNWDFWDYHIEKALEWMLGDYSI